MKREIAPKWAFHDSEGIAPKWAFHASKGIAPKGLFMTARGEMRPWPQLHPSLFYINLYQITL